VGEEVAAVVPVGAVAAEAGDRRDGSMQRHIVRIMRRVSLTVALMALAPLHAMAAADVTAQKKFASRPRRCVRSWQLPARTTRRRWS
jgi:hypothetical protein